MTRRSGNYNSYRPREEYHSFDDFREDRRQRQIMAPGVTMDGRAAWKTDQERVADLEADVVKLRDIVLALIDEMTRK
jgi:hypothetical protein